MLEKAGRKEVELLKIDIEKGEFTALEPLIRDYFVCQVRFLSGKNEFYGKNFQIFIEIHGTPAEHLKMLQTIANYVSQLLYVVLFYSSLLDDQW